MEKLCCNFLDNSDEYNAYKILYELRINKLFNIGMLIGKEFKNLFPKSLYLLLEYAKIASNIDSIFSFDLYNYILELRGLSYESSISILDEQSKIINDDIINRYTYYNLTKINDILSRPKSKFPLVTLTITTCKRFDLFEKTINSILNCFDIDKIDKWLCVDDNSSIEDQNKMKTLYPFFKFYFKNSDEKGHSKSMNIIKNNITTPYILHLEDDWVFYKKRNYITEALSVLYQDSKYGQCLFNKNYGEIPDDLFRIKGGDFQKTNDGFRFYIHEHAETDKEIEEWVKKYQSGLSCYYWPHFSFRPSLLKTKIINNIGNYNEECEHFEREYALRYINNGYISTFFEDNNCIHIGRLTTERHDPTKLNAYDLNNTIQFENNHKQNIKLESFVINLDRRIDRWNNFLETNKQLNFLNFKRFPSIDGTKLKPNRQLNKIFEGNDYNMRRGIVGCALSHIQLWINLINSDRDIFFIVEDDAFFCENFKEKLDSIILNSININWDIIFLGHLPKDKNKLLTTSNTINLEKFSVNKSLNESYGGAFGYIISKQGALNMLNIINETGMTNAIDTMQQKAADLLDIIYVQPQIITSDCHCYNLNIDSDIQKDNNTLNYIFNDNFVSEETELYLSNIKPQELLNFYDVVNYIKDKLTNNVFFTNNNVDIIKKLYLLCKLCLNKTHIFYTIDLKILYIITLNDYNKYKPLIYNERLKKYGNYDITDAIQYL